MITEDSQPQYGDYPGCYRFLGIPSATGASQPVTPADSVPPAAARGSTAGNRNPNPGPTCPDHGNADHGDAEPRPAERLAASRWVLGGIEMMHTGLRRIPTRAELCTGGAAPQQNGVGELRAEKGDTHQLIASGD